MATEQISDLTTNPSPSLTDVVAIDNAGRTTYKETIGALLGLASAVATRTIYYSNAGNDTTGNGTITNPFAGPEKSLAVAISLYDPASTSVLVEIHGEPGTYGINVDGALAYPNILWTGENVTWIPARMGITTITLSDAASWAASPPGISSFSGITLTNLTLDFDNSGFSVFSGTFNFQNFNCLNAVTFTNVSSSFNFQVNLLGNVGLATIDTLLLNSVTNFIALPGHNFNVLTINANNANVNFLSVGNAAPNSITVEIVTDTTNLINFTAVAGVTLFFSAVDTTGAGGVNITLDGTTANQSLTAALTGTNYNYFDGTFADYNNRQALTDGTTVNWNLDTVPNAVWTLTGNGHTLAPPTSTTGVSGAIYTLTIVQDGTGGWLPTFDSRAYVFPAGINIDTSPSAKSTFAFIDDGGHVYRNIYPYGSMQRRMFQQVGSIGGNSGYVTYDVQNSTHYTSGTMSLTGSTVTGVSTSFDATFLGAIIVWASGNYSIIASITDATHVVVSPSTTSSEASQTTNIHKGAYTQLAFGGPSFAFCATPRFFLIGNKLYLLSTTNSGNQCTLDVSLCTTGGGNYQLPDLSGATAELLTTSSGNLKTLNVQTFLTSGTYTPTSGTKYAIVKVVGGGGGGGGAQASNTGFSAGGSGGGAGGYAEVLLTAAQIGASLTITVGGTASGGTSAGTNGTNGNTSSFSNGTNGIQCSGGNGGSGTTTGSTGVGTTAAAVGGTASDIGSGLGTVIYSSNGQASQHGWWLAGGVMVEGGQGGSSIVGGAQPSVMITSNSAVGGNAGISYGCGGGGGAANNIAGGASGGNGQTGIVIVYEFISG